MRANPIARPLRFFAVTLLAIVSVSGCGEGSGKDPIAGTPAPALSGILVDAPVWGVSWETGSGLFGDTDAQGTFHYRQFENVTFSIGGIVLGTVPGAPIITAVELTGSLNATDQAAVNMMVFLQSIDNDQNPANGIYIPTNTKVLANDLTLDFHAADFSAQVAAVVAAIAPGNAVVDETDALNHFYNTYAELGGTDTFAFGFPGYPPAGGGVVYELVFADEFNEGTAPDPEKWNYETGYGPNNSGWGNNEWQLYTESPDNVRVEDGNLVISALCPVAPCGIRDGSITSGKINTLDKFNFRYGKVIARIKPPVGKAAWPAFWALGANFPDIGWPRSGEIDFMEVHNFYSDENTTHFTMHWWDDVAGSWVYDTQYLTLPESLGDDFHIFEADWDENRIIGKIDGITYFTKAIDPDTMEEFLEEFYLILNVAMGGTLGSGNQPPSGDEVYPQTMLVDYVRVFQASGDTGGGGTEDVVLATFDEATPPAVTEFGGAGWAIEPGPAGGDGTNALRITKDGGEVWAGAWIAIPAVPNDAGEQTISALVYSPTAGIPMVAKVEYGDNQGSGEVQANETVVEGWQTLTWTFTNLAPPNIYNRFVLLPDLGTVGGGQNYYFDNITLLGTGDGGGTPSVVITDFEEATPPAVTEFGGAGWVIEAGPAGGDGNALGVTRDGGEVWAGIWVAIDPVPNDVGPVTISALVYSPTAGIPMVAKLEYGDNQGSGEVQANETVVEGWQTLTWTFTNLAPPNIYNRFVLLPNLGTVGGGETYYIDNITLVGDDGGDGGGDGGTGGGGDTGFTAITFDDAGTTYTLTDFGGTSSAVTNDPAGGANQVGMTVKNGPETWAGTTISTLDNFAIPTLPLDASNTQMTVRVYSPATGIPVRLKVEDASDNTVSVETEALTTTANAWETLTFDFTNEASGTAAFNAAATYNKVSIFFDFGTAGSGETYYFDDIDVVGDTGGGGGDAPTTAAPTPTRDAGSVISLFSDAYTDVPVDTWKTDWSQSSFADVDIAGNATKEYTNLGFVGVETVANQVDITGMTHFHVDLWTPNATQIEIKLVDFGPNGAFEGNLVVDDTEGSVFFNAGSTPALANGTWLSLDIPLAEFQAAGLSNLANIAQLIFAGEPYQAVTLYVDNVYFYNDGGGTGGGDTPTTAAPTPTEDAGSVTSVFSDAYTDPAGVDYNPNWGQATVTTVESIAGGEVLKLAGLNYQGIDFVTGGTALDVSTHDTLHIDFWTPDATAVNVYLISTGPVETAYALPIVTGSWQSVDIPLSAFTGVDLADVIQMKFDDATTGEAATIFFDNIYFYTAAGGDAPTTAAPAPTVDATNVISLFSDAYTDVTVDTWRTDWSVATLADVDIAGNAVKEYTGLNFVGIETIAEQIDATGMTHFHVDIWTPNAESLEVKLVDFGADGAFQGGDDTEGSIFFDGASNPAPAQGEWISLDIPLADFEAAGMANRANIAQLIFAAAPSGAVTLYVDNVYFYNDAGGSGGGDAPTVAAPTPMQDAANVVSLFSDAYTDVTVDTWRTDWSVATLTDVTIDGNAIKQYTDLDFVGIEMVSSPLNMDGATHFHVDVWTPNAEQLRIKLVDFGADGSFAGGDDTEAELVFDGTTTPALVQGEWISLDIPLADFEAAGLTNRGHIAQLIFAAMPPGSSTLYVTNVYFYNAGGGAPTEPTTAAPTPTVDAGSVTSVFSDAYTDPVGVDYNPNWGQATVTTVESIAGSDVLKLAGLNYQGIDFVTGGTALDVSAHDTLHIDFWTADATAVNVYLISTGPAETPYALPIVTGSWQSVDIPLSAFSDVVNLADVIQMKFDDATTGEAATIFFDNIYFYTAAGGDAPTTAAPTPTVDAGSVTSVFSDAYTDPVGVDYNPNWGQATVTTVEPIAGGEVLKLAGLNYQGIDFVTGGTALDVSAHDTLHIDFWTPDATAVNVYLISTGPAETPYALPIVTGSWQSVDIPLSAFSGVVNLADVIQMKFDDAATGEAATIFFDNIYFYTSGGGGGAALVDFETAATGAGFTWAVFENDDNPPLEIIPNPDTSGINSSSTVGKITARVTGNPWAGTETAHGDVGPITLDASNSIVKVMVWKSVISDVGVKFAIASGGAQPEIKVPNTVVNQWEELTFDFSGYIGLPETIDIDQFIFFPDFDLAGRSSENVVYFDNVRLTDGS